MNLQAFPLMAEENVVWSERQLLNHQALFPQGQLVAEINGRIVGAIASLIVNSGRDPYRAHTYGVSLTVAIFIIMMSAAIRFTGPMFMSTPILRAVAWVRHFMKRGAGSVAV